MDEKQIRHVGKQIVDLLYEHRGFSHWWEGIEGSRTRSEIVMKLGRKAIAVIKSQQTEKVD